MKKLERLLFEKALTKHLMFLPVTTRTLIENSYQREIDGIIKYNADNPEIDDDIDVKKGIFFELEEALRKEGKNDDADKETK